MNEPLRQLMARKYVRSCTDAAIQADPKDVILLTNAFMFLYVFSLIACAFYQTIV